MSNSLIDPFKKNSLMEVVASYSDSLNNPKIMADSKKATISGEKNGFQVSLTITSTPNGFVKTESKINPTDSKSDLKSDIEALYKDGFKQSEIANITGMSQSYVSRLLKNK